MIISESEIASGILNDVNLNLAVQALHEVGYVTLEGVLPVHWVEELRIPFEQELLNLVGGKPPEAHGGGSPPVDPPFLDPLIIEHPLAMQMLKLIRLKVFGYYIFMISII